MLWPEPMKTPLSFCRDYATACSNRAGERVFCAICDGHEIPLIEITGGSRKSKLSDNIESDLDKFAKVLRNPVYLTTSVSEKKAQQRAVALPQEATVSFSMG